MRPIPAAPALLFSMLLLPALLAIARPARAAEPPPPDVSGASRGELAILERITDDLARATALEQAIRDAADARDPGGWAHVDALSALLSRVERTMSRVDRRAGEAAERIARWGEDSLATRKGILESLTALLEETAGPRGRAPAPPPPSPTPEPARYDASGGQRARTAGNAPGRPSPRPAGPPRSAASAPSVEGLDGLVVAATSGSAWREAVDARRTADLLRDHEALRAARRVPASPREAIPVGPGDVLVIGVPRGTLADAGIVDLRLAVVGRDRQVDRRVEIVHPALGEARRRLSRTGALAIPHEAFRTWLADGMARRRIEHGEGIELQVVYASRPTPVSFFFRYEAETTWSEVQLPVFLGAAIHFPREADGGRATFAAVPAVASGVRIAASEDGRQVVDFNGWLGLVVPGATSGPSSWRTPGVAAGVSVGWNGVAQFGFGADLVNGAAIFGLAVTPGGWRRIGIAFDP